jgi:hypothetical protein
MSGSLNSVFHEPKELTHNISTWAFPEGWYALKLRRVELDVME